MAFSNVKKNTDYQRTIEDGAQPKGSASSARSKPSRKIIIDEIIDERVKLKFISNNITTAKYNIISFLPKFLFEQFRRYANVFFLAVGLLQQIPDVSPTGRWVTIVPFMTILSLSAMKELIEDIRRHRADDKVNKGNALVFDRQQRKFINKYWKDVKVGDIVKTVNGGFFPADLVLLSSSEPQGMCYVETSNLDGETNLKIRTALPITAGLKSEPAISRLKGQIQCEEPNRNLYEFNGNIQINDSEVSPLTTTAILLRGARLMNTKWIYGAVVYTGHESKLLMNSNKAPLKRTNIDKITNYQIIFLFIILVIISFVSAIASFIVTQDPPFLSYVDENSPKNSSDSLANIFLDFLTFVILYNNLIPISLQVTLEFVKFTQVYFIDWDEKMYYAPTDTYANARTSNLNEELGQIKYVFSDKTGTLTQNVMEYKKASIAGKLYESGVEKMTSASGSSKKPSSVVLQNDMSSPRMDGEVIKDFMVIMSVCHTVIPEEENGEIVYNASSPDERALVEGALDYGFKFVGRKPESVIIQTPKGREEYEILNIVEFTSARKRMSVVARCPDGTIKLYVKGADSVITERLGKSKSDKKYLSTTLKHLDDFARDGLRTLCLATRSISLDEYNQWNKTFKEASVAIEDREEKIEKVASVLEQKLMLLGATAIEDKLQDGVPETIEQLLEAHINVWVLTGDKQETAINIGHSCRLLKQEVPIIILNQSSLDNTRSEINKHLQRFRDANTVGERNEMSLVIDGKTLIFALRHAIRRDFIELCCSCSSVICCRVSPIQKAEMVELVQQHTLAICLAIGDGANDVAMIQKAHVGVGISGNEGLQAANSSDFAIAQFRFLGRLLFLHGAWFYTRIAKLILYCFYKNICLYIIELWFAIYNNWTGQVLFERWTIGFYNVFFTSFPPMAIGLFDRLCIEETRMKFPSLYRATQSSDYFNHRVFWKWIGNSVLHSIILFWLPMNVFCEGIVWQNGKNGDYLVLGNIVYSCVMITVCLKAGLELVSWNWFCHASIWGSLGVWFCFFFTYSYVYPMGIPIAANMAGMVELVVTTPMFWLCCVLVPLASLIPDVLVLVIGFSVFPSDTDRIRLAEALERDVGVCIREEKESLGRRLCNRLNVVRSAVFAKDRSSEEVEEHEMNRGFAFSQEEDGAISQSEYIRRKTRNERSPTRLCDTVKSRKGTCEYIDEPDLDLVSKSTSTGQKTYTEHTNTLTSRRTVIKVLESPRKPLTVKYIKPKRSYAGSANETIPMVKDEEKTD